MAMPEQPAFDAQGFLLDPEQWSQESARHIAGLLNITLDSEHWRVLYAARAFYKEYARSPDMRPLVNWVRRTVSEELGTSIALMQLFPGDTKRGSTAKLVSQIAGLPKPPNCL